MLTYSTDEIVDCLVTAKNPNAAVKNFLKKEVQGAADGARFAKDLRDILTARPLPDRARVKSFIEKHRPDYENHLLCIARYAHMDLVQPVTEEVINKYSEQFNASFEAKENAIEIRDRATFNRIGKDVHALVNNALKKSGRDGGAFLKNVMLASIFDQEVLKHVLLLEKP